MLALLKMWPEQLLALDRARKLDKKLVLNNK